MASLRSELRAARRAVEPEEQLRRGALVADAVAAMPQWKAAAVVAVYQAHDGELDPRALAVAAVAGDKTVVTPAIVGDDMEFRLATDLEVGEFGILAPGDDAAVVPVREIDFVVNPLVGFDRFGTRIGRGRGFYDRAFADPTGRPFLCGVAHSEQQVDRLERNDWDVPLDAIVTEHGVLWPAPYQNDQ